MLIRERVTDAAGPGHRRLANFRSLNDEARLRLAGCEGIIGVAHRGHHTLNMSGASKAGHRIGDCMILVKWRDGTTTWETRSD